MLGGEDRGGRGGRAGAERAGGRHEDRGQQERQEKRIEVGSAAPGVERVVVEGDHGLVDEVGEAEEQDDARQEPAGLAREARVGGDGGDEPDGDERRAREADEVGRAPEVHVLADVHVPPLVERRARHGHQEPDATREKPARRPVAAVPPEDGPRADDAVDRHARVHQDVRRGEKALASDRAVPRHVPEEPGEAEPARAQREGERDRDGMWAGAHMLSSPHVAAEASARLLHRPRRRREPRAHRRGHRRRSHQRAAQELGGIL